MSTRQSLHALSAVDVGSERAFVINRTSGRWAILEASKAGHLVDAIHRRGELETTLPIMEELGRRGMFRQPYHPPTHLNTLIVKVTKRCNYGCTYCYDLEDDDKPIDLSYEAALAAIDEAIRIAQSPAGESHPDLGVLFHGGEPTLRFDFIKQLVLEGERLARERGKVVAFTVQSNLSHLTDEMVAFTKDHNLHWGVSLDGPPELNDKFRVLNNGDGTHARFERTLRKYPEFAREIGVLSTITSETDSQLVRIARHIRTLGVPAWKWSLFQPIGMGRHHAFQFTYSTERVIDSWNDLLACVEDGEFDGFDVGPVTEYLMNLITGPGPNMCKRNGCGAARDLLSLSSDGTIEACDCIDRKGSMGGLGLIQIQTRDSLTKALASGKAQRMRSRNVEIGMCGSCAWLALCGGTCMAHAGSADGIDASMCAIAMNGYTRLAQSLAKGPALRRYWNSLYPPPPTRPAAAAAVAVTQ